MIFGKKVRIPLLVILTFIQDMDINIIFLDFKEFLTQRKKKIRNPISLYVKKWFEYLRIDEKVSFK